MQRIKKTVRIVALQGRPIREEVRRGIRGTSIQSDRTSEYVREPEQDDVRSRTAWEILGGENEKRADDEIRKRDRYQKEKMKAYAYKRRHTAPMNIKVGDLFLAKQERKDSLTSLYDPVPDAVIGVKGDVITTKNNRRIRTRNY